MQKVQLYIEDQRVDLFEDEIINLTSSIQNVKDIAAIFSDFSQSFSIPASDTNNKIFKHFYNYAIENGFDARYKADARLELNHIPFRDGKIHLKEVELRDGKAHTYKLVFYGASVTMKDLIGEDLLSDLDLSDYNYTLSDLNLINRLSSGITLGGITDVIITPLISSEEVWYYDSANVSDGNLANTGGDYSNLRFALRIHAILQAISAKYNLVFSDHFLSSSNPEYYDLYMWLQREKGSIYADSGVFATLISGYGTIMRTNYWVSGDNVRVFSGSKVSFDISLTTSSNQSWTAKIYLNGSLYYQDSVTDGTYMSIMVNNLPVGQYELYIETAGAFSIGVDWWVNDIFTGDSDNFQAAPNPFPLNNYIPLVVSQQIPEMKVLDFLTGLFKMFNLTAYEDGGIIIVKELNSFYDDGDTYDISKYIDQSSVSIKPLSLYKELNFSYQGLGSHITKQHEEIANNGWGTERYATSAQYEGSVYKIEIPFEHMKYERMLDVADDSTTTIQWGFMADKIDANGVPSAYKGKPLLFYPVLNSGDTIYIKGASSTYAKTSYFIPSNSHSVTTDDYNINFKAETNEYTYMTYSNTLFANHYADYVSGLFNSKGRLYTFKGKLPLNIMQKYRLNDTLIIKGDRYRINSINSNLQTGDSSLELQIIP